MIGLTEVARLTGGRLDGKEKMTLQGFPDFFFYLFAIYFGGKKRRRSFIGFFFLLHVGIKIMRESAMWNF